MNRVYSLKLGDGSGWQIIATPGTRAWVHKFATIMKLKVDEQGRHHKWPGIYFFQRQSGKDGHEVPINLISSKIEEDLPRSGWKVHDFPWLRFWNNQGVSDVICEIGNGANHQLDIIRMWTIMYGIYLRVHDSGGLPLHAAFVELDGRGVLLAGPGGTGKSTLCSHLPRPWCILSDDQSLVVRNGRKKYLAHPIPTWSDCLWGRSERRWNVEHHVPLTAIFFIEQARSDEVAPLGQGKAAVSINHSSTEVCRLIWWNLSDEEGIELKKKIFENACQLAKAIPAYTLHVNRGGQFWEVMQEVL